MKRKGDKNISYDQRLKLETYLKEKFKVKDIAERLNLDLSTVYKEIKRGTMEITEKFAYYYNYETEYRYKTKKAYNAQYAQSKHNFKCSARGAQLKIGNDYAFVNHIEDRVLNGGLSACAALGESSRSEETTAPKILFLSFIANVLDV